MGKINKNRPTGSHFISLRVANKGLCIPEDKIKYSSKSDAQLALQDCKEQREHELRVQGWSNRNETSAYDCIFCKHWHLTSQQQQTRL